MERQKHNFNIFWQVTKQNSGTMGIQVRGELSFNPALIGKGFLYSNVIQSCEDVIPSLREAATSSWRTSYKGSYWLGSNLNDVYSLIVYNQLPVKLQIKPGKTK